jgi:hypothetical protein
VNTSDVVTITRAEYRLSRQELKVTAISSEQPSAVLRVIEFNQDMVWKNNRYEFEVRPVSSPGTVTVTSDFGGSATATVINK